MLKLILITAIVIELITVFGRFFFKISSKEVLTKIMRHYGWQKVIHFHHGFTGVIIALLAFYFESSIGIAFGLGMVLSDIIHHFVVLWFIIGDPEFHVVYRNAKALKKEEKMEDKKIRGFFKRLIPRLR